MGSTVRHDSNRLDDSPWRSACDARSALSRWCWLWAGARYAGQGGGPLRLRALAYAPADSVGDIIGAYGYGDDLADQGKFTLTLRRSAAGRWLIASDMDNGNAPARRVAPPPEAPAS